MVRNSALRPVGDCARREETGPATADCVHDIVGARHSEEGVEDTGEAGVVTVLPGGGTANRGRDVEVGASVAELLVRLDDVGLDRLQQRRRDDGATDSVAGGLDRRAVLRVE